MDKALEPGLHIVATPIGNLGDLSPRAAEALRKADLILAEDTRVTAKLLAHVGAKAPMARYDDHASDEQRQSIVARLGNEAIVLVSDAGTPLISIPATSSSARHERQDMRSERCRAPVRRSRP